MIRRPVDVENDALEFVSSRIREEIAQVFAKLDVASSSKRIPHDAFTWPEEGNEAVYALGVTKRSDVTGLSSSRPTSLNFAEELGPFFVLKS